ncbi:RVT_3 domain-containing protein, partial [Cephalotus follicularis]
FLAAATNLRYATNHPIMEAQAILQGLKLAMEQGWRKVILESHAENVITEINIGIPPIMPNGNIIEEIKLLVEKFIYCQFSFTRRLGNQATHELVKLVNITGCNKVWFD